MRQVKVRDAPILCPFWAHEDAESEKAPPTLAATTSKHTEIIWNQIELYRIQWYSILIEILSQGLSVNSSLHTQKINQT
jgi:hypothetical protein